METPSTGSMEGSYSGPLKGDYIGGLCRDNGQKMETLNPMWAWKCALMFA